MKRLSPIYLLAALLLLLPFEASAVRHIFRSVQRNMTGKVDTAWTGAASVTLTISNDTATFSSALEDTCGVGDALLYDTDNDDDADDEICFLSKRISGTEWIVKTAAGGTPAAVTNDNAWSIFRAYVTLANAEAGTENTGILEALRDFDTWTNGKNIVSSDETWNIACYRADFEPFTITGWTMGRNNYFNLFVPDRDTLVGVSQRHSGSFSTTNTVYMQRTQGNFITVSNNFVRIDGMQFNCTSVGANSLYIVGTGHTGDADIRVSNCIFLGDSGTNAAIQRGIYFYSTNADFGIKVWNCLFRNLGRAANDDAIILWDEMDSCFIFNNTFNGCNYCLRANTTQKIVVKNNLVFEGVSAAFIGTYAASSGYNASDAATIPGSNNVTLSTSTLTDYVTSVTDFHINPSATNASEIIGDGDNLSDNDSLPILRDIDGETRPLEGSFNIGCDNSGQEIVFIEATDDTGTEASQTTATFTVTRNGTSGNRTINYTIGGTATNTDDYSNIGTSVTINDGNATATVTITPVDDSDLEGFETVVLTLASGSNYLYGTPRAATAVIIDSEPIVTIEATDATATEASQTTGQFTVTRSGGTSGDLVVDYTIGGSATNTDDYSVLTTSVTITDGNATATITVTPVDDSDAEGGETVELTVVDGTGYKAGTENFAVVTITDNETTIPVYFSVGTSTDDLKSGSPTITISGGTMTVSSTQPDWVGVGDKVSYEPDSRIAYIHGRTDGNTFTVRTETGETPNAVSSAVTLNSIKRVFNEMDDAVDAGASTSDDKGADDLLGTADLTTGYVLNIPCYGHGSPDGDEANVTGWVTGANNYIHIYTPTDATEVGTRQRHSGTWNTSAYYMEKGAGINIDIIEDHVRVDGIQGRFTNCTGDSYNISCGVRGATADIRISNCILRGDNKTETTSKERGVFVYTCNGSETYRIWNNIVYDQLAGNAASGGIAVCAADASTAYIYNNTVARAIYGISTAAGSTNKTLKNNVCVTSNNSYPHDYAAGSTHNAGTNGTIPGSNTYSLSSDDETDYFYGTGDYRINADANYAHEIMNWGVDLTDDTDLAVTTDAADSSRPFGVAFELGANEHRGEPTSEILYRSVGNSTADLLHGTSRTMSIVDTIATFTPALPDTVGVGDVVQYQVSGTYYVSFVHGRNSSTEYVVKDSLGGTPKPCDAGTAVNMYRCYAGETYNGIYELSLNSVTYVNTSIHEDVDDAVLIPDKNLAGLGVKLFVACYADGNNAGDYVGQISGWATSKVHYLKVYAPYLAGEVGESQRHTGKWTNTAYTIADTDHNLFYVISPYVHVEGLQFQGTQSAGNGSNQGDFFVGYTSQQGEISVSNCIFDGTNSSSTTKNHYAFLNYSVTGNITVKFVNNVIFDYADFGLCNGDADVTVYAYNNTFVDCKYGYASNGGTNIVKNNFFWCTTDGISDNVGLTKDNNASKTASDTEITLTETSDLTAYLVGSEDFHINPSGAKVSEILDAGVDLSADVDCPVTTDIDDSTRPIPLGGGFDIGADEHEEVTCFDSLSWATTGTACSVWTGNWRLVFEDDKGGGITEFRNGSAVDATDQLNGNGHTLFDVEYFGAATWLMSGGSGTMTVADTGVTRVIVENERTILTDVGDAVMNIRYTVWGNGQIGIKAKVTNNSNTTMSSDMGFYAWMTDMTTASGYHDRERSANSKWVLQGRTDARDVVLAPYDTTVGAGGWTKEPADHGKEDSAGYKVTLDIPKGHAQQWQFQMEVGHADWDADVDSVEINYSVDDFQRPDSLELSLGTDVLQQAWEEYLHAHWPFNEGSGTDILDYSGNGLDGTNSGATYESGKFCSALDFVNGENDYVQIDAKGLLNSQNKLTLCAWINPDNFGEGNAGIVMDKADAYSIYLDGTNSRLYFKAARWTTDGVWHTASSTITAGNWYHVAVVYDYSGGTSEDPEIYLNGERMILTEETTPVGTAGSESNNLYIGNNTGTSADFDGKIGDVRFYATELADEDIAAIANNNWDAGRDAYRLRANANSIITFQIDGSSERRVQPAFRIDNWWHNNLPRAVRLDETDLTFGADYLADVDSANHILFVRLNKQLGGAAHELSIDDSDPDAQPKTKMVKMYYETAGDVVTVKNFNSTSFGAVRSGEWVFSIDNGSDAAKDRVPVNFKTAVIDANSAHSTGTAQLTVMDYFDLSVNQATPDPVDESTVAPTSVGGGITQDQSTTRWTYDSNSKLLDGAGVEDVTIRRKITVYPTGRIFMQTVLDPSSAIEQNTSSEQRLTAAAGAIHANTNPLGLDSAVHHTDSARYHFTGVGKQSFAFGVLGVKYNPTPTTAASYLIPGNTPTSNKIYTSANELRMGLEDGVVPTDGCTLAYFFDFSVPMWMNAAQRDSLVNDVQYPDALFFFSGSGSSVTDDQGDLNTDGFNEGEGCYVINADGNSANTVHFVIDTGTASPGVPHFYPAFKIQSYDAATTPRYVFVDSAAKTEDYDYNAYVNTTDDELIIQFNHVVRDPDTIYISASVNLAVKMDGFYANGGHNCDTLSWRTQSEEDNAGFNLYRRIKPSWWLAKTRKMRKRSSGSSGELNAVVFKDKWDNDTTWQIVNMRGLISGAPGGRSTITRNYRFIDIRVENGITYEYRLEDVDFAGKRTGLGLAEATPRKRIPKVFALHGNFPNPFNPVTFIQYDVPVKCHVDLIVYNAKGRRVINLTAGNKMHEPGYYSVSWDGIDSHGRNMASGIYFLRMTARRFAFTRKMLLVK